MRVGCYVRVSTQEQAKEGYSVGAQTERLCAYCKARDWTYYKIYSDPAFSGAKMDRPALRKLILDVENHEIDLVLVYKLDRLSRSQKDTLYLIEDVFLKNNVAFVSLNENFDTSTAFGRAMVGILSVFAQLEREQIKERTQMGRTERAKEGLWKGGGVAPIGYNYLESENQLVVNDYEAMQVREAFDLFVNHGYTINAIQKHMIFNGYTYKCGSWKHRGFVRHLLTNRIYIGTIEWNSEAHRGQHIPLISEEIFDKAQKKIAEKKRLKDFPPDVSPFKATQLLSGMIFCKHCGARYFGSGAYRGSHQLPTSQKTYIHIYTCYSRAKTCKEMIKDPNCKNKRWRAELLDNRILEIIQKLIFDRSSLPSPVSAVLPVHDQKSALSRHIAALDSQISKILDLYQFQSVPADQIAARLENLTNEKAALEAALYALEEPAPALNHEQIKVALGTPMDVIEHGTLEEKRILLQSLIKRIEIDQDNLTIFWRFA